MALHRPARSALLLHHGRLRRRGADGLGVGHQVDEGVTARRPPRGCRSRCPPYIQSPGVRQWVCRSTKAGRTGQAARIQDGFIGAGQGCKPPPPPPGSFPPAEVELDGLSAGVDCVVDEHGVSLLWPAAHPAQGRARAKQKLSPEKGKSFSFHKRGNKPAAKKPAAKHIFHFFSPWAHSMAQFPFLILSCRYFYHRSAKSVNGLMPFSFFSFVRSRAAVSVNF